MLRETITWPMRNLASQGPIGEYDVICRAFGALHLEFASIVIFYLDQYTQLMWIATTLLYQEIPIIAYHSRNGSSRLHNRIHNELCGWHGPAVRGSRGCCCGRRCRRRPIQRIYQFTGRECLLTTLQFRRATRSLLRAGAWGILSMDILVV